MKKSLADIREEKLDKALLEFAAKEDWGSVLRILDEFDRNNERRQMDHRAEMDITIVNREPSKDEWYCTKDLLRLSRSEDWNEIIFSKRPEDLYQLVEEYPVSAALKELTPKQKEILFQNIIHGIPTKDLAAESGCSTRNITKHRQKAFEAVRLLVSGSAELDT